MEKGNATVKATRRDEIDCLVDNLDRYYFRLQGLKNTLGGSEYLRGANFTDNVRSLFRSPRAEEAIALFYENAREADKAVPGISIALEEAAVDWQSAEEDFAILLGFVFGLRIAGMSSEQTKNMARTWRLGLPQDDEREGKS